MSEENNNNENNELVGITFTRSVPEGYNKGEDAGFPSHVAKGYVDAGVAVYKNKPRKKLKTRDENLSNKTVEFIHVNRLIKEQIGLDVGEDKVLARKVLGLDKVE